VKSAQKPKRPFRKPGFAQGSIIDTVIYGHDMDQSGDNPHGEAMLMFKDCAGLSSEKEHEDYSYHFDGSAGIRTGMKKRERTSILKMVSSVDSVVFNKPHRDAEDHMEYFAGHAGIRSGATISKVNHTGMRRSMIGLSDENSPEDANNATPLQGIKKLGASASAPVLSLMQRDDVEGEATLRPLAHLATEVSAAGATAPPLTAPEEIVLDFPVAEPGMATPEKAPTPERHMAELELSKCSTAPTPKAIVPKRNNPFGRAPSSSSSVSSRTPSESRWGPAPVVPKRMTFDDNVSVTSASSSYSEVMRPRWS